MVNDSQFLTLSLLHAYPTYPARPSSASSSSASSRSFDSPVATTMVDLPTPPSFSVFDSEMEHIFHETIDTSFLDSRPSSPSSFSVPVLEPSENVEPRHFDHHHPLLLSTECPPHLTLSLPPQSARLPSSARNPSSLPPRPHDSETRRQIDVLTTILTSPNLLPTSLPSLPIPVRPRSRSSSSSSSSGSTSPSRAKNEIFGSSSSSPSSTSMKSQKSWLEALKEAETRAKAKRSLATLGGGGGVNRVDAVAGFARL